MNEKQKVRIFGLPWHVAHQYELLKLPFDFTYLIQHTRAWANQARPMPEKLMWKPYYEKGKYDLAILHVDQQCLIPKLGKTQVFKEMKAQIDDIPIIVINHGTPMYPEKFIEYAENDGYDASKEGSEQWAKDKMQELLKGCTVIVNSKTAAKQWGFGKTIIHGLDENEWWDLPKEPRVVTFISPSGIGNQYYGRNLFQETRELLTNKYGIEMVWIGTDKQCTSWDDYRDFLGRSLIYFNPTLGSPMPRSRTEAMFSGCCVVTTKHHDAETFIKNGVNGFLVNENPEEAASTIAKIYHDYKLAIKVGQAGKQTAKELFSGDRFRNDWINLIDKVLKTK